MIKLFIILSVIFISIGIGFTIMPMGSLAFLPIGISLIFAFLAFVKSKNDKKVFPKWLLIITVIIMIISIGKVVFIKDEVIKDKQFDIVKEKSKNEAIQDLDELEDLE